MKLITDSCWVKPPQNSAWCVYTCGMLALRLSWWKEGGIELPKDQSKNEFPVLAIPTNNQAWPPPHPPPHTSHHPLDPSLVRWPWSSLSLNGKKKSRKEGKRESLMKGYISGSWSQRLTHGHLWYAVLGLSQLTEKGGRTRVSCYQVLMRLPTAKFGMPTLKLKFLERGKDHRVTWWEIIWPKELVFPELDWRCQHVHACLIVWY